MGFDNRETLQEFNLNRVHNFMLYMFIFSYGTGPSDLPLFTYYLQYKQPIARTFLCSYLHVRWGVDLTSFVVFVGENGDTDYEKLIGGVHKTVILKGVGSRSAKLQSGRSYPLEHVVPFDGPDVAQSNGYEVESIVEAVMGTG